MSNRESYAPGAASGARVQKEGEKWTLVLVRDLRHPPAMVAGRPEIDRVPGARLVHEVGDRPGLKQRCQ